jgi:hypothetical protein
MAMKKEAIKAELEQVRQANGGLLKAESVVEFARNPDTELHHQFTWDDGEAAAQYRLMQARSVIRVCVSIISEEAPATRAYVSLPSDRVNGGGYRSMVDVIGDEGRRGEMLRDALERLHALRRKYSALSELTSVWSAVEAAASANDTGKQAKAA